jgi:hypothetical protein
MVNKICLILLGIILLSTLTIHEAKEAFAENSGEIEKAMVWEGHIDQLYQQIEGEKPNYEVFRKGLVGYYNLKLAQKLGDKNVFSVVDFSLPSSQKRLWIIDLDTKKVLVHSLVAHGKQTGDLYSQHFSNIPNSNMSSLGFYVTGDEYYGKHGKSIRLNGLDNGYNCKAFQRAVVLHGANYVSEEFVKSNGRLGRSLGCPAVPVELTGTVIEAINGKTCLFIYAGDTDYEAKTSFLNENLARDYHIGMLALQNQ